MNVLRALLFLVLALLAASGGRAQTREELLELSGRPGATFRALQTDDPKSAPRLVALLLPGGFGEFRFEAASNGVAMINAARLPNRLRALLLERGIASLMLDSPTDRPKIDDAFRGSSEHLDDLRAAVASIGQRFPGAPILVVGHSNGSMSAAHFAAAVPERIAGSVLVAGRFVELPRFGEALARFDWARVTGPLLLIHHRSDGCFATPFRGSAELAQRVPRFELVAIGADGDRPAGGCTYDGTHNLFGHEAVVADAIAAWGMRLPPRR